MSTDAITYLGHASTVIRLGDLTVYTDPHFGMRALLPKRQQPFPLAPRELPPPDAVVISHAHYDHLDVHTFKYISDHVPIIVPVGLAQFLGRFISNPIIELEEEAVWSVGDKGLIRAVPAEHCGGRISHLRYRRSLGYLVEAGEKRVYFAGDTGYHDRLQGIRRYGPINVALLPIGPIYPKFLMKHRHLDPDDALRLFNDLEAEFMIPIHWGVFRLGLETSTMPLHWLQQSLSDFPRQDRVVILQPGEELSLVNHGT